MKTTIGGDRLGSGNKQKVSMRNYERSTHDLSYLWRSSMASGTLVPFMSNVALPGDSFDIDLNCECLTLPTLGPLFGSFKVQLDVFQVPMRLYQAALHMNKLGIGMDMSSVYLPLLTVPALVNNVYDPQKDKLADNAQISSSCLLKYLGISGIGKITSEEDVAQRDFNAIPFLGYWDIYKNYYANKQEERGFAIHINDTTKNSRQAILAATVYVHVQATAEQLYAEEFFGGTTSALTVGAGDVVSLVIQYGDNAQQPIQDTQAIGLNAVTTPIENIFTDGYAWNDVAKQAIYSVNGDSLNGDTLNMGSPQISEPLNPIEDYTPSLVEFDLSDIDDMRAAILQAPTNAPFYVASQALDPYQYVNEFVTDGTDTVGYSVEFSQECLGIKTYQSDLFNNWISTEWIDGANGINEVTAVDTTGDSFTIDALNLAQKVYNMLNRIAISGGSYDDWLDAVYTHERARSIESPMYLGSLIKELAFESVISNADTAVNDNVQPLGTLAGRGRLTSKNKGGKIKVRVDEPSYLIGIASLTPRVDYSQGNNWDVNLVSMNDFHKPALDAIGFQELITEQMAWQSTEFTYAGFSGTAAYKSAGKQPAWINYMTAVNKTYGNFAEANKEMFMTLNRRYDIDVADGSIADLTTYIDPTKFNQIFADTNIDAQNFWMQISCDITARRKMSAKIIPNL